MNKKYNISIIGLGLIGGSLAKDWRALGHTVFGIDNSEKHQAMALDLGLVDEITTLDDAYANSDFIVLAMPVTVIKTVLPEVLDKIRWNTVVMDMGSTKFDICESIKGHEKRGRFVAAHPLAGTEFSGPTAAISGLFKNKKFLLCEEHLSDDDAMKAAANLLHQLGSNMMAISASNHDKHLAYVSHLSHVSSFALGLTVLDIEKDENIIQNLAGTGFASTVRLAKSSPETWTAIFDENSEHLSDALGNYIQHLQGIKNIIDSGKTEAMLTKLRKANEIKRILNGLELNIVKLS